MPVDSYHRLFDDIVLLTRLEETIDPNPGNLLINISEKTFHLIDYSDSYGYSDNKKDYIIEINSIGRILPLLVGCPAIKSERWYCNQIATTSNDWLAENLIELSELRQRWKESTLSIFRVYFQVLNERGLPISVAGETGSSYLKSSFSMRLNHLLKELELTEKELNAWTRKIGQINRKALNSN